MNQLMEGYYWGRIYKNISLNFQCITFLTYLDKPNKAVIMAWPWKIRVGEKFEC